MGNNTLTTFLTITGFNNGKGYIDNQTYLTTNIEIGNMFFII